MGLFNFFRRRNGNTSNAVSIPREVFIDESEPSENGSASMNGSASGIESIYAFLQADYESKGYEDALANPDDSYKKDNITLLKEDLHILVQKVSTYYEDILRTLDFHIASRERAGLIDLVEELKSRRDLVSEHLKKVAEIRQQAEEDNGISRRIILSYQRGFMKGLMAISQSTILNKKL